jgi:hypothetical protein
MRCGACINIRSAPIRGNAQGTVRVGRVNVEQETRKVSERYDGTEKVQELKQKGGGLARVDPIGTRLQYIRGKGKPCQGGVLVKERRFKCFAVALSFGRGRALCV